MKRRGLAAVIAALTASVLTVSAAGTDAYTLRDWLLTKPDAAEPADADFNQDGVLNACDLTLLKRDAPEKPEQTVLVSDIAALFTAMRSAKPSDVIRIAPGTYDYTVYQGAQKIDTQAAGTAEAPIRLTAADPAHPPVLTGTDPANGYVLHIQGDYWIIENLRLTNAQKGIVFDHSCHSVLRNCEIDTTGAEAAALRDGSSDCTVESCSIHDTGLVSPGYGEGVYVGSAKSVTGFDYKCDNNRILHCTFKNIAAEHIDVKEYTTGTEIAYCTFYGDGMTGENYAGSFVDIAGNACSVHDNTGFRNQNPKIVAAFEIHEQAEGWGHQNRFFDNTVYMDQPYSVPDPNRKMYVVDGWFTEITAGGNQADLGSGLQAVPEDYYNVKAVHPAE